MKKKTVGVFLSIFLALAVGACVATDTKQAVSKGETMEAKKTYLHRHEKDSVFWKNVNNIKEPEMPSEMAREWPGEKAGLAGPIVATGGVGRDKYIVVFDATGALVGGIMQREAKKHPEYLLTLILAANDRSKITVRGEVKTASPAVPGGTTGGAK